MDMRQFAGSSFLTVESLRDGPRQETIVSVAPGRYDKPVLTFESGDMLTLNKTNVNILIKNYGADGRDWAGVTVELAIGTARYNGDNIESVVISPVTPPKPVEARTPVPKTPPKNNDMDDKIPF